MRDDAKIQGLASQVLDLIKHDIVWCKLGPGQSISEAQLCEKYKFGKAPIRQALSRLIQEGLVVSVPRSGHVITPVTLQSVNEVFELRMILEPAAVEKACGNVDAARLRKLNAKCAGGYVPGDIASEKRFMEANRNFHMEIARSSGNSRIYSSLCQIMDEMTRLLHLGFVLRERPDEMHQEHDSLIAALENNDKELAREMTAGHIATVRKLVILGLIDRTNLISTNISASEPSNPLR
ncbi:MAG: GntR family transcriptional regulator [Fimbriimonadaceae bacterium]